MTLTYVVCAAPRVGSTHLCEALAGIPGAGRPREWFGRPRIHHLAGAWDLRAAGSTMDEPRLSDPHAYLRRVRAEAETDGVLALKLHWSQVEWVRDHLGVDPLDVLADSGDVRFIRLYRHDLIAQTVSSFIASSTKVYQRRADSAKDTDDEFAGAHGKEPDYDFGDMLDVFQILAGIEYGWGPFFTENAIEPHILQYEELDSDLPAAVNGVLDYLGLPRQISVTSPLARQRTALNAALAERFRADLEAGGVMETLPEDLRRRCRTPA